MAQEHNEDAHTHTVQNIDPPCFLRQSTSCFLNDVNLLISAVTWRILDVKQVMNKKTSKTVLGVSASRTCLKEKYDFKTGYVA